jgi:hypothetical protein
LYLLTQSLHNISWSKFIHGIEMEHLLQPEDHPTQVIRLALEKIASSIKPLPRHQPWTSRQLAADTGNKCELCCDVLKKAWGISWLVPPQIGGEKSRDNALVTCVTCNREVVGRDWLTTLKAPSDPARKALEKRRMAVLFRSKNHRILQPERNTRYKIWHDLTQRFVQPRSGLWLSVREVSYVLGWPESSPPTADVLAYLMRLGKPALDEASGLRWMRLPSYMLEENILELIGLHALLTVIDASDDDPFSQVAWSTTACQRICETCEIAESLPQLAPMKRPDFSGLLGA